jgi:hypothetical protein
MAQFERALTDYKVAAAGYDVLFSEPDNFDIARGSLMERLEKAGTAKAAAEQLLGESNDQAFAKAIKDQGKTILAYSFGTLDANGRTSGVVEQGFTTDMILPAPLPTTWRGFLPEWFASSTARSGTGRRSRSSTMPRIAPAMSRSIRMTTA